VLLYRVQPYHWTCSALLNAGVQFFGLFLDCYSRAKQSVYFFALVSHTIYSNIDFSCCVMNYDMKCFSVIKAKAVPLHATKALGEGEV
jgi:hypothetical protein